MKRTVNRVTSKRNDESINNENQSIQSFFTSTERKKDNLIKNPVNKSIKKKKRVLVDITNTVSTIGPKKETIDKTNKIPAEEFINPVQKKAKTEKKERYTIEIKLPKYQDDKEENDDDLLKDDIDAEFNKNQYKVNKNKHWYSLLAESIDRYRSSIEMFYSPLSNYMDKQNDITPRMRSILVDWMVEVADAFNFHEKTLYQAVNIVDRYLSITQTKRGKIQLIGCVGLLIAGKYEEIEVPAVTEFVLVSGNSSTEKEMMECERKVLHALNYRICDVTRYNFLERFIDIGCKLIEQQELSKYLTELSLLEYKMLSYRPSLIAASAVYLTRAMTFESKPWTCDLHYVTRYFSRNLGKCVTDLKKLFSIEKKKLRYGNNNKAIPRKYMEEDHYMVATYAEASDSDIDILPQYL